MNESDVLTEQKSNRWRRVTAITGAGLLAGLIAIGVGGVGGVASAQTVITETNEPTNVVVSRVQVDGNETDDSTEHGGADDDFSLSVEDEAVFDRFDQCLREAGLDVDSEAPLDETKAEAAFEQCDPILDDLSDDFDGGFAELSPEDEGVYDRYDECLQGAGLDFDSDTEPSDDVFDAAFEQCDPILEDLSEEAQADFGDAFESLSPEDEAVFDRYDSCLNDAGLDVETEADVDEATVEAAFEGCEPILDELSEAAHALLDCPDE